MLSKHQTLFCEFFKIIIYATFIRGTLLCTPHTAQLGVSYIPIKGISLSEF